MLGGFLRLNKKELPFQIIVVEGKSDVARLSTYFECEYVITNGYDVPRETIHYLKEAAKTKDILILTDPDYPGLKIREILSKEIPSAHHAFVDRRKSIKGKKLGVAECERDELLRAINSAVTFRKKQIANYDGSFLFKYRLTGAIDSKERRQKLMSHFNLGYGNAKTLLKRLNTCDIPYEDLIAYLEILS